VSKSPIAWLNDVAEHDYDAAHNYLSLKFGENRAVEIVDRLKKATLTTRRANDILRASGLPALPLTDPAPSPSAAPACCLQTPPAPGEPRTGPVGTDPCSSDAPS
jgi:hypothetical protein